MCSNSQAQSATGTQSLTAGVHHLGLSVEDVKQSAQFFCDVLQFKQVGEKSDYPAIFISDGIVMLTLWQTQPQPVSFNRQQNVGLHHFALKVADEATLLDLHQRLQRHPQVEIEFSPELLGENPIKHMMCLIPGGIRMELIAMLEQ